MVDKLIIRAVYEDGVFKPLEPLDLPEHQLVEFEVQIAASNEDKFDFEGALTSSWESMSAEQMEKLLQVEKQESLSRLMEQIEGGFEADDHLGK